MYFFIVFVLCFVEAVNSVNLENLIFKFVCNELQEVDKKETEKLFSVENLFEGKAVEGKDKQVISNYKQDISNLRENEKFKKLFPKIILQIVSQKSEELFLNIRSIADGRNEVIDKLNDSLNKGMKETDKETAFKLKVSVKGSFSKASAATKDLLAKFNASLNKNDDLVKQKGYLVFIKINRDNIINCVTIKVIFSNRTELVCR